MRRYLASDLDTINRWRAMHALNAIGASALPDLGLIVDGVAAGFLLRTESPQLAILDSYVTNPEAGRRSRYDAVVEITMGLSDLARSMGIQRLIAMTGSGGIEKVARRIGYGAAPMVLVSREIA